jgi:hypothetical protein
MTDTEYEILDELYFVISFQDLKARLEMQEEALITQLKRLNEKGWIRVFTEPDGVADVVDVTSEHLLSGYLLASKSGLKSHNS